MTRARTRRRPPEGEPEPDRSGSDPRRRLRIACAFTVLAAVLAFLPAFGNGFAFDDVTLITDNDRIASIPSTFQAMGEPYMFPGELGRRVGLWRPTTTLYYGLARGVFGLNPLGFHVVNIALHALISVLVLLLALRFLPLRGAVAAGLLFAVHPVHSEAVANVVGAAELIPAVLSLGALLLFIRWREEGGGDPRIAPGAFGPVRVAVLSGLYAVAVLAKESAIMLPALLVLTDLALAGTRWQDVRAYVRTRAPLGLSLVGVTLAVLAGRFAVLGALADPAPLAGAEILLEIPHIWTVAPIWAHYVRLMVFPISLSPEYAPALIPIRFGWDAAGAVGVAAVLASLAIAWAAWRAGPTTTRPAKVLTFGVLWFAFAMLPASNALFLSSVLLAERTLYLPSVGFVLMVGWVVGRAANPGRSAPRPWARRATTWAFSVVVILFAFRTFTRSSVWKSTASVNRSMVLQHPELVRSQEIFARTLANAGYIDDAERALLVAELIAGYPGNFTLELQSGRLLARHDRLRNAVRHYERAVDLAPSDYRRTVAEAELAEARAALAARSDSGGGAEGR